LNDNGIIPQIKGVNAMSLKPSVIEDVPKETARIARAAFPKGNLYISMRDELGTLFADSDFTALYPTRGQPAFAPWRLALITVMQFLENLSDRQASDAVRSRIDWKYALSLELTDSGFDYSVLSNFRERLLRTDPQSMLLDRVLEKLRAKKLLKERGKQRTDSTHVLAAIRTMNRLELVTETMRAALNELASIAPEWTASIAPTEWFTRYSQRIEDTRLPRGEKAREEFALAVGRDGFLLLELINEQQPDLLKLEKVNTLQRIWERHYSRNETGEVCWRKNSDLSRAATAIESPYDIEARHSNKREFSWTGYKVHLSETCDEQLPRLITNVQTTVATTQDVASTSNIQESLAKKNLLPNRHFVDTGYVDAGLLVESAEKHNIELFGPTRFNPSWQSREGGYDSSQFLIDWDYQKVICPEGKQSVYWYEHQTNERYSRRKLTIKFRAEDCRNCSSRDKCVRNKAGAARHLNLPVRAEYEALAQSRKLLSTVDGQREYQNRAGIEGTISQGVRLGTLRRSRYRGLQKTHLQEIATATGINLLRTINFLNKKPLAKTRTSRFAKLTH
jgi:transposase